MKLKLKIIKEDKRRILYKIDQEEMEIDNKKFKIKKSTSNLSAYLNSKNESFLNILNSSIDCKCINCSDKVENNWFLRNIFTTYKFCNKCDNQKTIKLYTKINCKYCNKEILYKNSFKLTCGNINCINLYKKEIGEKIKNNHWIHNDNNIDIINRKIKTRKENDLLLNREYKCWNKGKTGIYSKETIEKIRNSTINQMKNGRIKKTKIELIFENLLIKNNINYKYSFVYKKRQYDFLLIDYNMVVEIQGDYWHANPMFWDVNCDDNNKKKLYESQKMKIKDDVIKKTIIKDSKYSFLSFWEYDLHNNIDKIERILLEKIKN